MVMAGNLEGKVALVTGGSSGIGRASALVFAREGAKVVVADMNVEGGEQTVDMINEAGDQAIFVKVDVSKAVEVEEMINRAVEAYGRLDCAHNNAGIELLATITDCTEEDWDRLMDINLKGVWLCLKYEIPQMIAQGGGAIVNTASVAGLVGSWAMPAYSASKHGVIGLTKSAALNYAKTGIRVNAVCPGIIHTSMIERMFNAMPQLQEQFLVRAPVERLGTPEEVAETVAWLCSDAASFVTGHAMAVDGGLVAQ
jgi:NAD(P)-dependent dehydrogenase (short-subunit alcohol dehydrogenase family)